MITVYTRFSASMDRVDSFIDIFSDVRSISGTKTSSTTSRTAFTLASKRIHRKVSASNRIDVVAYDGTFLHVCSEFELTIRDLVDRYIDKAALKYPNYANLPDEIKSWYPEGCAQILLKLNRDAFSHLNSVTIISSLASISRNLSNNLVSEAFSYNDRNFSSEIIKDCFAKRLGIKVIWNKVARHADIQAHFGTGDVATAEKLAKDELDQIIRRRNHIMHRGRAYYTASHSEIADGVKYLRVLIKVLAEVMEAQIAVI